MFFSDRLAAYAEMRRVLRPGATFRMLTWGPLAENSLFLAGAEVRQALGHLDASFAQTLCSYCEHDKIESELKQTSFQRVRITRMSLNIHASNEELAAALVLGSLSFRRTISTQVEVERQLIAATNAYRKVLGSAERHSANVIAVEASVVA